MRIGRKIYYDKLTGNVIADTGEAEGDVRETTIEQDIQVYKALSERNRDTFSVIKLEFGQYRQDFMQCNGYRINHDTLELEFSYPGPNVEVPTESIYQKSLSEELIELKQQTLQLQEYILNQEYEKLLNGGGM